MRDVTTEHGDWSDAGPDEDPGLRLLATLVINGCAMHLAAFRVRNTDDIQELDTCTERNADLRCYERSYEDYYSAATSDGHWHTVEIAGKPYVLIATPYCI